MRTKTIVGIALALGLSLVGRLPAHAGDMETAKRLYDQAKAESSAQKKVELLRGSLAEAETFEARYALGEALVGTGAQADARREFQKALESAGTDKAKARAAFGIGETMIAEGATADGVNMLRQSIEYFRYPQVEARLKEIELRGMAAPMSASEIQGALSSTASRAFGVKPRVNLRIGFDLDKATLNPQGERQAKELGQALAGMSGKRFRIVGHTDKQGDDAYNDKLSLRRAETVRDFMVKSFGLAAASLPVEGKGERQLLYPGDSQEDHALNRRVEVIVED